jgi:hypothetical protein
MAVLQRSRLAAMGMPSDLLGGIGGRLRLPNPTAWLLKVACGWWLGRVGMVGKGGRKRGEGER